MTKTRRRGEALARERGGLRRGFTLVEMMAVVGIIGALSALAVAAILNLTRTGRTNGLAGGIQRVLANARTRAVAERCPYFVQINGPTYNPAAAPVDVLRQANVMLVYRKGDCASTVPFYESGTTLANRDKLVASYQLDEFRSWLAVSPAGIVPGDALRRGGAGSGASLTIGYRADGQRTLAVDGDGDGASAIDGTLTEINVVARQDGDANVERTVDVPAASAARLHQ